MTDLVLTIDPKRQGGAVTVPGTRIPASAVAELIEAGDAVDTIAGAYGLTREEVLLCCWHEFRYYPATRGKRRKHQERLRVWADGAIKYLGGWNHLPVASMPDPPREDDL